MRAVEVVVLLGLVAATWLGSQIGANRERSRAYGRGFLDGKRAAERQAGGHPEAIVEAIDHYQRSAGRQWL